MERGKKGSVIDSIFLISETFCNQSGNDEMENLYMKILCILSRLAAVIIIASFGAVISSFVSVETFKIPFTNVEEFFKNGQYKILLEKDKRFEESYFQV